VLFWKKRSKQESQTISREHVMQWRDGEIPRYPPFMKGLPAVSPEKLLETQAELIERIADTAIALPAQFERYYLSAIERFTRFAHLLPASQSHHHRGAGGLLRHSLEVGLWALQSADKVLLDAAKTPSQRREMEPRWHFAVFVAALCHDAGKPVTDLVVANRDRTAVWKPIKEDLYDWAKKNKIDAYFLDWRDGRSRQHTALSNLIADRIIGTEALEWIEEGGTELIVWLLESLNCNPGPANLIHDLVIKADQTSVERDLKSLGVAMAGYDLGVPVERHLTDIMRRFVREGVWLINEPGARLWNIGGHLYMIWPAAGEELARQVREDGIPGIPRTPDGILDMLVERQIAFVRDGASPGDRFWKIAPACLVEKIPDIKLSAIRLRDEAMVSSVPIPAIDGQIVVDEEANLTAAITAAPDDAARHPEPATPETLPEEKPTHPDAEGIMGAQNAHATEGREMPPRQIDTPASTVPSSAPAVAPGATESKRPEVTLDGAIGEALKALLQDIKSGDKRMGEDAVVDASGHLILRWPDAFAGYGLTPKNILDELSGREWLWIDPMAPLKKVLDFQFGSGAAKAIRLEREISDVLIGAPGALSDSCMSAAGTQSESVQQSSHQGLDPGAPPEAGQGLKQPAINPKRNKRMQKSRNKGADPRTSSAKEAGRGQKELRLDPEGTASQVSKAQDERSLPTLDDVFSVLMAIPMPPQEDGWRSMPKREAIAACRKRGVTLTHARLADLAQQHTSRIVLDGIIIRYRA
jgi:conjugal transfer pilus assembly protein TraI